MKVYVYILLCSDNSYFIGITDDLEYCLFQHLIGLESKYTKSRLPVRYVFCEEFASLELAKSRRKQLRGWRREKKEALIDTCTYRLPVLAQAYRDVK